MTYEKRWDEMRRDELGWGAKSSDEMKCGVWRVQCEVWSLECEGSSEKWEVWSVDCEVWSLECEECSVKCGVWPVKCGVLRVQCEVKCWLRRVQCEECSVKGGVWSAQCEVWRLSSVKCDVGLQMWHVKQDTSFAECTHARASLAHGACKFYRWERSYIYL